MSKDTLFDTKRDIISDFNFKKDTVEVFDDMLSRSVPFYAEVQRMMAELVRDFAVPATNVYDLGCSTGTTLLVLDKILSTDIGFVGIDYSDDMLARARQKVRDAGVSRGIEFACRDLNEPLLIDNASVVIMNLVLQFIRPLYRRRVVESIARGMNEGGCFIMVEKVLSMDSTLNRLFIRYYYDFKRRQGYTDLEIAQKREALENVLIPYRPEENRELLLNSGFSECDMFFKWYNFTGMLAIK